MADPMFLTVREAADYLRISTRTVYRLIESGDLPGVRVGKHWRLPVHELETNTMRAAALREHVRTGRPIRDCIVTAVREDVTRDPE